MGDQVEVWKNRALGSYYPTAAPVDENHFWMVTNGQDPAEIVGPDLAFARFVGAVPAKGLSAIQNFRDDFAFDFRPSRDRLPFRPSGRARDAGHFDGISHRKLFCSAST